MPAFQKYIILFSPLDVERAQTHKELDSIRFPLLLPCVYTPQFHLGQWQAQIGPGRNFRALGKNNPGGLAEPQPPWQMGSQRLWIVWRRCTVYKIGREIDCDCMELSFAGTI